MQFKPVKYLSFASLIVFCCFWFAASNTKTNGPKLNTLKADNFRLAADYSRSNRGLSMLVIQNGKVVFEEYHNGHSALKTQLLASGTKSFSGVMFAAAIEDGLIKNFDEKVSDTITEWKTDRRKSQITIRELLTLTSGIESGPNGRPPSYTEAITFESRYEPGTTFEYGPVPFQVFGELMKRKLAARSESVLDYLNRRIFEPIGLSAGNWTMQEGQPNLPSGAYLTTREWAKFGELLINEGRFNGRQVIKATLIRELTKGTKANPNYGLTFWLNKSSDGSANIAESGNRRGQLLRRILNYTPETEQISLKGFGPELSNDIFAAAGAGKQRLYVVPSKQLVIVRQGRQSKFDDGEFLRLLLLGRK
ncbi:MAG: serine hydrolase [Pyrinomonadaceae bacterium]